MSASLRPNSIARATALLFIACVLAFPAAALEGVVRDADGEGLAGIEVRVTTNGRRHETVTGPDGAFAFDEVQVFNEAIIELTGEEGTGRVAVLASDTVEPLELAYPVVSEVVLLHDNDQHFDWNYTDAIRSEIYRVRSLHTNVFLLNAGDIFVRHADRWGEPDNEAWYSRQAVFGVETMNRLRYDVMTAGNHEFDHKGLLTRRALERANFPILAANMTVTTDRLPPFEPFTVLTTREGYTVAVLGLSTGTFEGVRRRDPIETAQEYLHLGEEHNVFVALTHIGYRSDQELAEAVPELDVIIGGHSHTLLETPELVNGVLVAQAGGGGHYFEPDKPAYLGKITIVLENGVPVRKSGVVRKFTDEGVRLLTPDTEEVEDAEEVELEAAAK